MLLFFFCQQNLHSSFVSYLFLLFFFFFFFEFCDFQRFSCKTWTQKMSIARFTFSLIDAQVGADILHIQQVWLGGLDVFVGTLHDCDWHASFREFHICVRRLVHRKSWKRMLPIGEQAIVVYPHTATSWSRCIQPNAHGACVVLNLPFKGKNVCANSRDGSCWGAGMPNANLSTGL